MRVALGLGLLAATLAAGPAAAQTASAGKGVFARACASCHYAPDKADDQPRIGPSLKGVVGRKAGTLASFKRYSPAMKGYGKPWTEASLDAYLASPRSVVKGTTMGYAGLKDPKQRADLIAYLKKPV